jgi:drug/metabolite transporter (DMT)-like permease
MTIQQTSYIYALSSILLWSLASQAYTKYSQKISAVWVTGFKTYIGFFSFFIMIFLTTGLGIIPTKAVFYFLISGFIGLGIGDIFLIKSFSLMGPGRTMMIFAFQPVFIGILSYFLFQQDLDSKKLISIIFFIICIFIFALEGYKKSGKWHLAPFLFALAGMILDGSGVIITRLGFENSDINATQANLIRFSGGMIAFLILARFVKFNLVENFKTLSGRGKTLMLLAGFFGTFLALWFYLKAIQTGHLASLSGIMITGVVFAALFECIFFKKLPSKYLIVAFGFFLIGIKILFS